MSLHSRLERLAEQRAAAASVHAKFAALVASNPLSEEPDAEAQARHCEKSPTLCGEKPTLSELCILDSKRRYQC